MNNEYRYLVIFAFWIAIWFFFPLAAFPLFIIVSVQQFMTFRKQRKNQEIAKNMDRERWALMEGFSESENQDTADWWKE